MGLFAHLNHGVQTVLRYCYILCLEIDQRLVLKFFQQLWPITLFNDYFIWQFFLSNKVLYNYMWLIHILKKLNAVSIVSHSFSPLSSNAKHIRLFAMSSALVLLTEFSNGKIRLLNWWKWRAGGGCQKGALNVQITPPTV